MNQIKALRRAKGYTQQTLADAIGCTKQAICNYERGARECDYSTLIRLADLLGVTTDALLGRELPTPNDQPMRGGSPMNDPITLNDLLALCECDNIQLTVPLTERLTTIVSADLTDSAELDDIVRLYGDRPLKGLDINSTREELRVTLL